MDFLTIFLIIGGIMLFSIGIIMIKKRDQMFSGVSKDYVIYKGYSTMLIGLISAILGVVTIFNKSLGNKGFYVLLGVLIIMLILDKFMKKQA